LRTHHDDKTFFSFEELLQTLIHEICHCEVGPHNAKFHKLMDELVDYYSNTKWPSRCDLGLTLEEVIASNKAERRMARRKLAA